ncbi:hypothetical protein BH10ACI3_BH10ACI3_12030 [soil metagenome]
MKLLKLVFFALILAASVQAIAARQTISSGDYGSLVIGANEKGKLTGYFSESTGLDDKGRPRFTCSFLIVGESIDGESYNVRTWHPVMGGEVINGTLSAYERDGKTGINLKLDGQHGGCSNVAPSLKEDDGQDFMITTAGTWYEVRMVSAAKSFFYIKADIRSKGKAFVVKNDVVRIFDEQGVLAQATYVSDSGKTTRGFLNTVDLYPIEP